jgi:subtilase family serine protease
VVSLSPAYAPAQATHGPFTARPQNIAAVSDRVSLSAPGSPCLIQHPLEISNTRLQPASTNGSLSGHVIHDIATGRAGSKGELPPTQSIQMELVFAIRNQPQFEACLASIEDPRSPNYGHFLDSNTLSPYLPTPGQKASIAAYFIKRGFSITNGTSPLVLEMTADVKHIEGALGVKMYQYSAANSSFYGVSVDPRLPTNFLPIVGGIMGLNDYVKIAPAETPCGPFPPTPYCPNGIQTGYSLPPLYASGDNGTGQKVAIVDVPGDPNMQASINTFDTQYGLPATTLNIQYPDGPPSFYDPTWASETAMDVEAVHTIAPGAGIVLLYDDVDLMNAIDYVATNHLATIVSNSWGYACGSSWCSDTQLNQEYPGLISNVDGRLSVDAAQGLTILFASGDEGARPDGSTLGTEFPASDPNVLAVGGTDLTLTGCGSSTCSGYGSETGWSGSSGGYSGYFTEPSWQSSTIGSKSGRAVPDVSMVGQGGAFWVYSTASDRCTRGGNSAGWFGCGGTSLSTPLWAGFLAIALQIRGGGSFGNIDPLMYQVASSSSYASTFHDITSGSNNGYSARMGWDEVTGWGTPIANVLAFTLSQVTFQVNGLSADATGTILTVDSTNYQFSQFPLAVSLTPGTHTVSATTTITAGTGKQYVWVSWSDSQPASHTITVSGPATYTITYNTQYFLTLAVNPSGAGTLSAASGWQNAGATVPVTESANAGYSFYYWSLDGSNVGAGPSYSVLMNAAHTLTAVFRGTSTISLSPSSSSISLGNAVILSGTITPTQPSPGISTGTTVYLSLSTDGGSTWSLFLTTSTTGGGTYSTSWTPPYPASYQLRARWSGDSNYAGASSTAASLSVTGSPPLPVRLLVTGPSSASRGSTATFDVFVNETSSNLKTTLYIDITGPGGYEYFDALNVTQSGGSSGRYSFNWQIPNTLTPGTYTVTVGLIPNKAASFSQTQVNVT